MYFVKINVPFVLSGKEYVCVLRLHDTIAETKLAQVILLIPRMCLKYLQLCIENTAAVSFYIVYPEMNEMSDMYYVMITLTLEAVSEGLGGHYAACM